MVADRGYFKGDEVLKCEQAGITTYVPKPLTSNSKADGRFDKQDFVYLPEKNEYECPAGQSLICQYTNLEAGLTTHAYWTSTCKQCAIKAQCTKLTCRRVRRWAREDVIDAAQQRLDRELEKMRQQRQTVLSSFGTSKHWMGSAHFLTKTMGRVSTEMSHNLLVHNLKRVIEVLGVADTKRELQLAKAQALLGFENSLSLTSQASKIQMPRTADHCAWAAESKHCSRSRVGRYRSKLRSHTAWVGSNASSRIEAVVGRLRRRVADAQ